MLTALLFFCPPSCPPGTQAPAVELAVDAKSSAVVRWVQDVGVTLENFGPAGDEGHDLFLGEAYRPRFGPDSTLYFDRGLDDGERMLSERTFAIEVPERGAKPQIRRALANAGLGRAPSGFAAGQTFGSSSLAQGGTSGSTPRRRIFIDPGHGGTDPGGVGFGNEEADIVLDVSLRLRDLLLADDADTNGGGSWEVLLSRTTDTFVSLGTRTSVANAWAADRFVSIHANAFSDPQANGTETFSFQNGTFSANLRDAIQAQMIAAWGLTDRGSKTANFFVLVNTAMPATLSELGFITNAGDLAFLLSPAARQDAALAHLFALQDHFGLTPYEPQLGGPICFGDGGSGGCTPCPCGNEVSGSTGGCLNGFGTAGILHAYGLPSVAQDTLRFELADANPMTFAILVSTQSLLPTGGVCPVGSGIQSSVLDGLRCVGGALLRHGVRSTDFAGSSGVNGNAGWGPPNGPAGGLVVAGGFQAGQTRHFQVFYREDLNLGCGRGQNTSNAWSLVFQP